MKHSVAPPKATLYASYLIALILCLVPFHALLTTWAGSNFGHLDLFRIIKELLMVPLGFYAGFLAIRNKDLFKQVTHGWLSWLLIAYSLLFVSLGLIDFINGTVNPTAIIYSLLTNLRFLWFMAIVWIVSSVNPFLSRNWQKIVLAPAAGVIGFGILQRFVLPIDFLRHFGYGPDTIVAYQTVDQKIEFQRIQSTLRGANPLGAYLILVLTTAFYYLKKYSYVWLLVIFGLAVLFFSYSRSGLVGLAVSLVGLAWLSAKNQRLKRTLLLVSCGLVLIVASFTWLLRNNNAIQNIVFHSDESSLSSVSSNDQRLGALTTSVTEIWQQPLGAGPGTAGPASFRNDNKPRIAENYFLQLGQEVGVLGMIMFATINILVAWALWQRRSPLAYILLASLAGITVVNFVSHAWVDDTLAILWWGLAGVALSAPAILKKS